MSITLTTAAADRVRFFMEKDNAQGLRLGIRKSGCSGWAYEIDMANDILDGEQVFEQNGVRILVHSEWLEKMEGMEIDFVQEGLNRVFKFNNPNVTASCGCGESISFN